jgi:hypothetical protein
MRHALLALLLGAGASIASAGGEWDGIYSCGVSAPTISTHAYITVNTNSEGRSLFAVAAVAPNTPFYGYGIGQAQGNAFSGQTMLGKPFSMTYDGFGYTGTIGTVISGRTHTAYATCVRVW